MQIIEPHAALMSLKLEVGGEAIGSVFTSPQGVLILTQLENHSSLLRRIKGEDIC